MSEAPLAPLVHRPVTEHRWEDVVFAHWRTDPGRLADAVPRGTRPDVVDGSAWVGLCAYRFRETRVPPLPPPGRLGTLTEVVIEVLTVDAAGRHGTTYRTVDTSNVPAIVAAHAMLGVPYTFAHARSRRRGDVVAHRSVRHPARDARPWWRRGPERPGGPARDRHVGPVGDADGPEHSGLRGLPGLRRLTASRALGGLPGLRGRGEPGGSRAADGTAPVRHDAHVRVTAGEVVTDPLASALTLREGIHARHVGQTFFWQREHPPLTLRSARLDRLGGDLPGAVGMPWLFGREPDSLVVLDGTTVRYAWGDVVR